jgi:hypothetical protein
MKLNIFKNHPPEKLFEELDLPTMETIYSNLVKNSSENEKTLLILDDIGASMKDKKIQMLLRRLVYNRRHLKCSINVLLQSYLSCPKEIRKLMNNIFMFKPSRIEFENLAMEAFEMKKDIAIDIMKIAYQQPHQYLLLNVDNQRLFIGFDELLIKDE